MRVAPCVLTSLAMYACSLPVANAATPLFSAPVERSEWTAVRGAATPDKSELHDGQRSLRIEAGVNSDARIQSAPVSLEIGKTYELSGWVRTEDLTVNDSGRTPIASGAMIAMASMPFDVHSASIAGTRDWTRLSLRFVASRASDRILLTAGSGGGFHGKAWFEGVSLDEASPADSWPTRDAIQTFGPAYRYPDSGWIYLHIEGKPYDRGYQHGFLMAKEIPEYLKRCAFDLGGKTGEATWDTYRTTVNALFLRGFDKEILEEMRGIADGANAAGAKWLGRKLDLVDIVLENTEVELGELESAMPMTPTGLEGAGFMPPPYAHVSKVTDHCSAFAATGPATRDGKMVIGHVTWWPETLAEQTNVMLDIKPETGHRVLMQSYPGGIESGTDWYQNDAGVVLTETTIRQTPFNVQGTPVAFRARMAIQYGGNVDEVVKQLGTRNNGLYTNEWIIGDAKNNEIAMYELGTSHTKLWRSSKNEWFGGTTGFYWGNNNAKDMDVKMEYLPDPQGAPEYVPFVPTVRDLAWQALYSKYKGQIDEQFGFEAYDSAPLVSSSTMDAKIVTSDMANHMMVWAAFGRPNQTVWKAENADGPNHSLYPAGYRLFSAVPSDRLQASITANETARLAEAGKKPEDKAKKPEGVTWKDKQDELWKGWILPASDADMWFVAGSAAYYHLLQVPDVDKAIEGERIRYRGLQLIPGNALTHKGIETAKGVLFLDSLRRKIGDEAFLKLMVDYFSANTTKTVTAQSFLDKAGVSSESPDPGTGPAWMPDDIRRPTSQPMIVYGTLREAGTNRYTAEQLQLRFRDELQRDVPVYRDFEATDQLLAHSDVIFIGRPETNSALAPWVNKIEPGKIGLDYSSAQFKISDKVYASERNALVFAGENPLDASRMVLVYAGNSPLATAQSLEASTSDAAWIVLEDGKPTGPSASAKAK